VHRFLLVCLALPASALAFDRPETVGLHTVSVHSAPGYNGTNPGLYLLWPNGVAVGAFHNSYRRNSAYVGWLWRIDDANRFGVLLGAATGYGSTRENMPVAPLLVPSIRWALGNGMSTRLSLFPDPRQGAVQVLHLSFEWALDKHAR
jgi:hypothetical protein